MPAYRSGYLPVCPATPQPRLHEAWGEPGDGTRSARRPTFPFRAARFGNVTVALPPDRGRSADRRADYHDPTLPPRHALLAFGLWLQQTLGAHALIHVGAHGTLEWLPGKTVALRETAFPRSSPARCRSSIPSSSAIPARRRRPSAASPRSRIGHLPPPLTGAGLDERRTRARAAGRRICAGRRARPPPPRPAGEADRRDARSRPASPREAGVATATQPDEALRRIDAWLCDLKDFAIKDGLHIYGRAAPGEADPLRAASARPSATRCSPRSTAATSPPGPAGAPARGRTDVLPTGRNLFTADPRTMPTPTAFDLGRRAADEVLRRYAQDHGDWPRALVIDLWGSATLRTGGEEIAQGLALMGCRPAMGSRDRPRHRRRGAAAGRARPAARRRHLAHFRPVPRHVPGPDRADRRGRRARSPRATRTTADNPLAAAPRASGKPRAAHLRLRRPAPTAPASKTFWRAATGDARRDRPRLSRRHLARLWRRRRRRRAAPGAFAERVASAELLIHTGDDPGRDMLEGSADVAFIGGFAAALAALGRNADLIVLDTTDPAAAAGALAQRGGRARRAGARHQSALHRRPDAARPARRRRIRRDGRPRWSASPRPTDAVAGALIEAVHDAYLGDPEVRAFMLRENPAAAAVIAERFAAARRRGLWHPRRNSIDDDLAALIAEARAQDAA